MNLSARQRKIAFIVVTLFSVSFISWLAYGSLDQAVTISYMQEGYSSTSDDLDVLMNIAPSLDNISGKKDLLLLLRKQNPDAFIVENDNSLQIGQLEFLFSDNDKLVEVKRGL